MSSRESDSESDAPEEFTAQQGIQQDEEIRKVQKENKNRVIQEEKRRRREWAQKLTPRPSQGDESIQDVVESEQPEGQQFNNGMLPNNIVQLLAAREKQVFLSDSDEEKTEKRPIIKKKRAKSSRRDMVILEDIPPPQCLQNSLEFLKKRKMQVPRSSAVLNNSNQALRLLSKSGSLSRNDM